MFQRRFLRIALLLCAVPAILVASEAAPVELLDQLDRVSRQYHDQTIQFACDERVEIETDAGREEFRQEYEYSLDRSGRWRDRWLPVRRGGTKRGQRRLDQLGVELRGGNSWLFLFGNDRRNHYNYRLEGEETALGRPAWKLNAEPIEPYVEGVNEWFVTVWVDKRDYTMLRAEAIRASEEPLRRAHREAIETGRSRLRSLSYEVITTEFGIQARHLRLPSAAEIQRASFKRSDLAEDPEGHRVYRIRQEYDNYRFLDVMTRGEGQILIESWLPPPG